MEGRVEALLIAVTLCNEIAHAIVPGRSAMHGKSLCGDHRVLDRVMETLGRVLGNASHLVQGGDECELRVKRSHHVAAFSAQHASCENVKV